MKVKILDEAVTRTLPKKDGSGTYTKTTSNAIFETPSLRFRSEFEWKDQASALKPGDYTCDVEDQLKPGRFGLELPRNFALTPVIADAAAKRA